LAFGFGLAWAARCLSGGDCLAAHEHVRYAHEYVARALARSRTLRSWAASGRRQPCNTSRFLYANMTVPEALGSAFALLNLVDDLGKGVGVFLLSKMLLLFEATSERTARQQGISVAFSVGWPLCEITSGVMYWFIERDYARAQADVAGALASAELAPASTEPASAKRNSGRPRAHEPDRCGGPRQPAAVPTHS
jgi:hypothetical protein